MSLAKKAINFDLSTNELKKHFSNTAEAYNKAERGEQGQPHHLINDLNFHNSAS